jgi:hypothetical protein
MWTRRLRSISEAAALAAVLLFARPAPADEASIARLAAAPASKTVLAGVSIDRIAIPGLHVSTREERAPERGGITLAYADDQNEVRVLVRIAVAQDAAGARAFAERVLRGVSGALDPSTLDETAFAGDRLVVAAHGNVAYSVEVLGGATRAADVVEIVKRAFVAGAPTFPRATMTLPPTMQRTGAPLAVAIPTGATHRLRVTGGYVARDGERHVVHPFDSGTVEVTAIVSDALGRVTEVSTKSVAR